MGTYVVQDDELVGPSTLVVADSEEETLPDDNRDQLLGEKEK